MNVNLKQEGTWEINAMSYSQKRAVVYDCTLETALMAGCALIDAYYSGRTCSVFEKDSDEFRCESGDDPWYVDVKKIA